MVAAVLNGASPAQRAAFAVVLGHATVPALAFDPEGQRAARQALDDAARWVSGEHITPEALTDLLVDEAERGLSSYEGRCTDDAERRAWMPVQTALAYVAWRAWRATGRLPAATVCQVSEETLHLLDDQVQQVGTPHERLARLATAVMAADDLGPEALRALADAE